MHSKFIKKGVRNYLAKCLILYKFIQLGYNPVLFYFSITTFS